MKFSASILLETETTAVDLLQHYRGELARPHWTFKSEYQDADAAWTTWLIRDESDRLWMAVLFAGAKQNMDCEGSGFGPSPDRRWKSCEAGILMECGHRSRLLSPCRRLSRGRERHGRNLKGVIQTDAPNLDSWPQDTR